MTVTTRRQRRQQQRRQQQRSTGGGGRSPGLSQAWVVVGVVVILVAIILIGRAAGVFEPPAVAPVDVNSSQYDAAGETIGTKMPDLGNTHIPTGQKATYNSVPPTSGEHWAAPAAPAPPGIKDATLPNEVTTHDLEHGAIVVAYNGLAPADVDQLKALMRQLMSSGYPKVVVEPYPDLKDAKVALTSWDWILKLQTVDQAQVIKFFRAHYDSSDAPEKGVAIG